MSNLKLSIVVPHYNEPEDIYDRLLSSIKSQVLVDFSQIQLIVVQDGPSENEIDLDHLKSKLPSNLEVDLVTLDKNRGVAEARNEGILRTRGKYVLFIDCDDFFTTIFSMARALQAIDEGNYDYIAFQWCYTPFSNERVWGYNDIQRKPSNEGTNIHAKLFKRNYIVNKNIKFPSGLRCHEDTCFLGCAIHLTDNKIFIDEPLIWYGENRESLTRKEEGGYATKTWYMYHDSIYQLFSRLEEENCSVLDWIVTQNSIYCYFEFYSNRWLGFSAEKDKAYSHFLRVMKRFWKYFIDSKLEVIEYWYSEVRNMMGYDVTEKSYLEFMRDVEKDMQYIE